MWTSKTDKRKQDPSVRPEDLRLMPIEDTWGHGKIQYFFSYAEEKGQHADQGVLAQSHDLKHPQDGCLMMCCFLFFQYVICSIESCVKHLCHIFPEILEAISVFQITPYYYNSGCPEHFCSDCL